MNIVADREDLVTIPATMERDMKIWVTMKRTSESMVRMLVTVLYCAHTGDMYCTVLYCTVLYCAHTGDMSALGDHR